MTLLDEVEEVEEEFNQHRRAPYHARSWTTNVNFWNPAERVDCYNDKDFIRDKWSPELLEILKSICISCPLQQECLRTALAEEGNRMPRERHCIRGGLTPQERYLYHKGVRD